MEVNHKCEKDEEGFNTCKRPECIKSILSFDNGNVAVFCKNGRQMRHFQGMFSNNNVSIRSQS